MSCEYDELVNLLLGIQRLYFQYATPPVLCNTFGFFLITFFMLVFVHSDLMVWRIKADYVVFLTFKFAFRAELKAL